MGRFLTKRGEEAVDWKIIITTNWIFLFTGLFIILPLIPYFTSPYVLFIPNAMDEALVEFIGRDLVKPLLVFVFFLGGMMGLPIVSYYHRIFSNLRVFQVYQLRDRQFWTFNISSYVGPLPVSVYIVLTNFSPIATYQWGRLVDLFIILPPLGCMIVTAAGILLLRYWTEKREKKKMQLYRLIKEKVFVLELV